MNIACKYNNYDLNPRKAVPGYESQAWDGAKAVREELSRKVKEVLCRKKRVVLCVDVYPGVKKAELMELALSLKPAKVMDMEDYAKSEETLNREFRDFITDDPVFGVICHKKLKDFFDAGKLEEAARELAMQKEGLVVIAGVGAGYISRGDVYVYCSLTRWEIQLRYRRGMPNWHCSNYDAPSLEKYKRGFFIEWRLADRYKKERYEQFDYVLVSEEAGNPKLITGRAFLGGLTKAGREPFRMEPYFDPGVWGGRWMQKNFGLDSEKENFAWCFDGVLEENCLNFTYGQVTVKIPAIDLVLYRPHELLGERVHGRFGTEFPIRFDLLDTMGGGNLSLQVHPLTEYIQDSFGLHYTQDESYYILDTDGEASVFLGVKNGVDREAMAEDLKRAEKGEISFPAEKYVNRVPVKKHDHLLIPAGTIHCSGKNTMVLEISATPYIFTFKLWDWGRAGGHGGPRPLHVEHGLKNIQWDRDTDWIYDNLVRRDTVVSDETGKLVERTGLHKREFIETYRYRITRPVTVRMKDSFHMLNLVEGARAKIESLGGEFEPFELHYAETAVVPAAVREYRLAPCDGLCMLIVASVT